MAGWQRIQSFSVCKSMYSTEGMYRMMPHWQKERMRWYVLQSFMSSLNFWGLSSIYTTGTVFQWAVFQSRNMDCAWETASRQMLHKTHRILVTFLRQSAWCVAVGSYTRTAQLVVRGIPYVPNINNTSRALSLNVITSSQAWSPPQNICSTLMLMWPRLAGGGINTEHRAHGWLGLAWIWRVHQGVGLWQPLL